MIGTRQILSSCLHVFFLEKGCLIGERKSLFICNQRILVRRVCHRADRGGGGVPLHTGFGEAEVPSPIMAQHAPHGAPRVYLESVRLARCSQVDGYKNSLKEY